MRLRQRIVLTLLATVVVMGIPATYALLSLGTVHRIASELKVRDTEATSNLGSLRKNLEALQSADDNAVVLINIDRPKADSWRGTAEDAMAAGDRDLAALIRRPHGAAYRRAVTDARHQWETLKSVVRREFQLLPFPTPDDQDRFRGTYADPAYRGMTERLKPIDEAIGAEAEERVRRASDVATAARNTTLVALALSLALTVIIGILMTRAMLRPIDELGRGMSHVAEGDFEPDVRIPVERPDEIGDLARSFSTMTAQLAELDRLKAEFVSVASHEIKTPLSVIRGYVSLLADGIYGSVNDQQKKTLEAVSDQVDRLTRLVHRLLDISRFEAGGGRLELRRINVRDFLEELTSGFRVLAFQNGIDFHVQVAGDAPVNIEGDADRLNEVLGNILSNAFKFTERGGRIALDAERDGTGLCVAVRDSGVGIPADKLPKIFEKFYQVDNSAQPRSVGSGLGLAIAREIVEAHGGTITAESEVGKGTMFRVTLPERPPAPRAAEPHAPAVRR
ncbi:HAMP domain-containing sensor histidine kinase [Longimicrobium sp.]|uniref:sensor histidine kinase n=1 Tax=Longimicrobium sp. TaxID=2029185 RepID=UPI002CE145A0|nr:HAMP domain-containing sensor histidine kinase [Longimicrobium sp.]HSU16405.1 HAMP domain-containing sensor histidine kinase [Longimicrobium sp.]